MKFLHMADLHLGRRLGEIDLLPDQRAALEGILSHARARRPDVCLIAGDVYDRSVPPAEAVELLSEFLTELSAVAPVCLIGGNHDSQERLSFGRDLLGARGLHIAGRYRGEVEKVRVRDAWGEAEIWMMPFFRAREARAFFPDDPPETIDQAVRAALRREGAVAGGRKVLLLHQFVTAHGDAPTLCDSESPLDAVGGLDAVDARTLDPFCYVALGHLHCPQRVGRAQVRYAGSPLKYSASEAGREKSLVAGEIDGQGEVRLEFLNIPRLHDVRRVRGTLEQLTAPETVAGADPEDYLFATLTDPRMPAAPRERLESIYPNLVRMEYQPGEAAGAAREGAPLEPEGSPYARFSAFFEMMNGRAMDPMEAMQAEDACRAVWEAQA